MLSRVADAIYWMCRYIERAENTARFVDVNLHLHLDLPGDLGDQWEPLVRISGDWKRFEASYKESNQEAVMRFLLTDREYPSSLISCLTAARENARCVREIISSELWQQVNEFYHMVREGTGAAETLATPHDFLHRVKNACHLFNGIMGSTMSHNESWHFGRMGQLLERADKTTRILDMKYFILLPDAQDVGTPYDNAQWASLLKSASSYEMYRKQYGRIDYRDVAEFLVLDDSFPRAVRYCVGEAEKSLHEITGRPLGTFGNASEKALGKLRSELEFTQIEDIVNRGLHQALDDLQLRLIGIGDAIFEDFLALQPVASTSTLTTSDS